MKMKKFISSITLLAMTATSATVIASANVQTGAINATMDSNPYKSKYIVFTEQTIKDGKTTEAKYEVWYNDKGYYRMNTVSGPYAGDYEIWDGKNLYQYTKMVDDLITRDLSNENGIPVPHPFLSTVIASRIKKDVEDKKLDKQLKSNKTEVYTRVLTDDASNKVRTEVALDKDKGIITESNYFINEKPVHVIKVENIEKLTTFDDNLLNQVTK
jgi:outer membrane lipoprotein-sorting protein